MKKILLLIGLFLLMACNMSFAVSFVSNSSNIFANAGYIGQKESNPIIVQTQVDYKPGQMVIDPTGKNAYILNLNQPDKESIVVIYTIESGVLKYKGRIGIENERLNIGMVHSIAINSTGEYIFISTSYSDGILIYKRDKNTGLLNYQGFKRADTNDHPSIVVADPTGPYVYLETILPLNNDKKNLLYMFKIDNNGSLKQLDKSPMDISIFASRIYIDPLGKFVYINDSNTMKGKESGHLSIFKKNGDGTLSKFYEINAGKILGEIVIESKSGYAYITDYLDKSILIYQLDNVTSKLKFIGKQNTDLIMYKIIIDPKGRFLFAISVSDNSEKWYLYAYLIYRDKANLESDRIEVYKYPEQIIMEPTGNYIYFRNLPLHEKNSITRYKIPY